MALDDLKPFAVEIALRFQDGTLTGARPAGVLPDSLEMKQKDHSAEQVKIKNRLTEARRSLEATTKSLDEAEKGVSTADVKATDGARAIVRGEPRGYPLISQNLE
jgi:hypothetical protein